MADILVLITENFSHQKMCLKTFTNKFYRFKFPHSLQSYYLLELTLWSSIHLQNPHFRRTFLFKSLSPLASFRQTSGLAGAKALFCLVPKNSCFFFFFFFFFFFLTTDRNFKSYFFSSLFHYVISFNQWAFNFLFAIFFWFSYWKDDPWPPLSIIVTHIITQWHKESIFMLVSILRVIDKGIKITV